MTETDYPGIINGNDRGQENGSEAGPREERSPGDEACPVCDRLIQAPIPEFCPHCQAPVDVIFSLVRLAGIAVREAERDLNAGSIRDVRRKLDMARLASKDHRIHAEIIRARLDSLSGDPAGAIKRLRAVRDVAVDVNDHTRLWMENALETALKDQLDLARCCEIHNFALYQAKRGHYEEARDLLQQALRIIPSHAPSHALLGKVHYTLRENAQGRYHLERAIAIDPSNQVAAHILGLSLRKPPLDFKTMFSETRRLTPRIVGWIISMLALLILILLAIRQVIGH